MSQGAAESSVPDNQTREGVKVRVTKEWRQFSKLTQLDIKADPMQWWAERRGTFPLLASIAQKLLAIPASSAPTEISRFFNICNISTFHGKVCWLRGFSVA
jgi:hypothetical protein